MKKILFIIILLIFFSCKEEQQLIKNKIPIIYSKHYNIKLFGLQKLHPFDTEKSEKIYKYLKGKFNFDNEQFYFPNKVSEEELLKIHTNEYLKSLNKSNNIAEIAEMRGLSFLPPLLLRNKLLKPVKYAVGGTLLGVDIAIKYGFAVNLSGGFHHAKKDSGEGFSFFADINLAIKKLNENYDIKSIMIIDLDAHQGNGYESIIKNDSNVYIFDVYNKDIFPDDTDVKPYIDFNFPIPNYTKDSEYLSIIKNKLLQAIDKSKPDFIIYNAGTDIYKGDLLGKLSVTTKGIIERDELVFKYANDRNIPILMLLSGGYSKKSAEITGKSIENILQKYLK